MKTDDVFIFQLHDVLGGQQWNGLLCLSFTGFCTFPLGDRLGIG
ncbi:MAG: hypothetical protein ACJ788_12590 [Ktedonobacteraceae bacterium]